MSTKQQMNIGAGVDWKFVTQYSIIFSILAYLIFIGGRGGNVLDIFIVARANLILFTVLFICWLCFCIKSGNKTIETDYIIYALLFMGVTFASVLLSDYFWQSFNEFYIWGLYFLIFVGVQNLIFAGWKRERILNCFLIIGGIANLIWIISTGVWLSNWLKITNQGWLAIFNYRGIAPNQSAAFANLVLMMALARFINNRNDRKKATLIFVIISSVSIVLLTSSRGGMLGMASGVGIVIACKTILNQDLLTKNWKNNKQIIISGVILILVFLFIGEISSRFRLGLSSRYDFWMVAFQSFKEHPIFGTGLYTMGNQLLESKIFSPSILYVHAHNLFLNILGELGIVGFCLFILLITNIANKLYIKIGKGNDFIAVGALGALGSFLAHGLVDTLYVEPYLSMSLIIIISSAIAPVKKSEHILKPLLHSGSVWLSGFVICIGWILFLQRIPLDKAILHYEQDRKSAVVDFEKLEKWKPKWSLLYQQRAIAESFLALEGGENQLGHITNAILYLEKAIDCDPSWATNYANLAVLYKTTGEYTLALEMMKQASELAPDSALIALNYAIIAEEIREFDLAKNYYWNYILLGGIEDSGPFWQETTLRAKIYYENRKSILRNKYIKWDDASNSGAILPGVFNNEFHLQLAQKYIDRGEYQLALGEIKLIEFMGLKNGINYLELLWIKANLEIKKGEYKRGLVYAQSALDGWRYQSVYGPGTFGESKYSGQLHRSPSIKDDLVPQFEIAPIPETWIDRMVIIGQWYSEINATEDAKRILLETISIDSNNEEASSLLKSIDNK